MARQMIRQSTPEAEERADNLVAQLDAMKGEVYDD